MVSDNPVTFRCGYPRPYAIENVVDHSAVLDRNRRWSAPSTSRRVDSLATMTHDRRSSAPTLEDVALVAGVSRALVSLVMRASPRVSVHSRTRVLDAAATLGYRPNLMARNLAARSTMTIGVLLNDLHNPWFADVADGIHDVAEASEYQLILASGRRTNRIESRALDTFLASRVDGIIVAGSRLPASRLLEVSAEVPLVSVGRTIRGNRIGNVTTDDALGARLAVDHLVALGHRRIVHIDGGKGAGAAPRRAGYRRAMLTHGLGEYVQIVAGDFTEEAGANGAQWITQSRPLPTAIFTANDLSAVGAIVQLERHGLRVPGDIAVVGFDNTSLAALNHIGLTTIDQPNVQMGATAAQVLIAAINDHGDLPECVMTPQLVVRQTTVG
jgi:DNA-binding LacI/PurR family transcriptional regulator